MTWELGTHELRETSRMGRRASGPGRASPPPTRTQCEFASLLDAGREYVVDEPVERDAVDAAAVDFVALVRDEVVDDVALAARRDALGDGPLQRERPTVCRGGNEHV